MASRHLSYLPDRITYISDISKKFGSAGRLPQLLASVRYNGRSVYIQYKDHDLALAIFFLILDIGYSPNIDSGTFGDWKTMPTTLTARVLSRWLSGTFGSMLSFIIRSNKTTYKSDVWGSEFSLSNCKFMVRRAGIQIILSFLWDVVLEQFHYYCHIFSVLYPSMYWVKHKYLCIRLAEKSYLDSDYLGFWQACMSCVSSQARIFWHKLPEDLHSQRKVIHALRRLYTSHYHKNPQHFYYISFLRSFFQIRRRRNKQYPFLHSAYESTSGFYSQKTNIWTRRWKYRILHSPAALEGYNPSDQLRS